jgi:hypothetical protein
VIIAARLTKANLNMLNTQGKRGYLSISKIQVVVRNVKKKTWLFKSSLRKGGKISEIGGIEGT